MTMKKILAVVLLTVSLFGPYGSAYAAGSCAIFRSWVTGNTLTPSDLTTSFTTVTQTNMIPTCMDDNSANLAGMQGTQDPYPAGSASLAVDLKGELERLRFAIEKGFGWTNWYVHPGVALTSSASHYGLTGTWNNALVTFPGSLKLNVTDTASAAGSLLMDLQLGAVSMFRVTKAGNLLLAAGGAGGATVGTLTSSPITAARTWTFPDITGIVALTNGGQTFTNGVWNGTIIGTTYGGTGLNTAAAPNGNLLIGNGAGWTVAPITAGLGTLVTNGAGSITLASTSGSAYGIRKLVGANNAITPNTQYDLSADLVVLRNPTTGATITKVNTGTLTNDTGVAGPAADGRDQAGAFGASTWLHFYFIVKDDGTLATLSSTVAPPTGPTLPATYTSWAYAGAVRFDGGSALLRTRMRGAWMYYDSPPLALSGGTATTETAVSLTALVPPNVMAFTLVSMQLSGIANSSGSYDLTLSLRASAGSVFGSYTDTRNTTASSAQGTAFGEVTMPAASGQQFFYLITVGLGSGQALSIHLSAFQVPNGGE